MTYSVLDSFLDPGVFVVIVKLRSILSSQNSRHICRNQAMALTYTVNQATPHSKGGRIHRELEYMEPRLKF